MKKLNHYTRSENYNYIQHEFNYKGRDFTIYTTDFDQNDECDAIIMMDHGHGFLRIGGKLSKLFTEQSVDYWLSKLADIMLEDFKNGNIR